MIAIVVSVLGLLSLHAVAQETYSDYVVGDFSLGYYDPRYYEAVTAKQVNDSCTSGAPPVPIVEITIADVHNYFLSGQLTCTELVSAYVQRINAYDAISLQAIQTINPAIESEAAAYDADLINYISTGATLPPLFCVPMIIKDNYDLVGVPTTAGAVAFNDNFPFADATMVSKVKAQGAIILAKGTMSEWAQSATNSIGSNFGIVKNSYQFTRTTGGSSGGPASATAANLGLIAFGTDTGSSIRTPSAFHSLVGIRPSIGLISRKGIVPLNFYTDTGGPIGRTVTDVATVFGALPGPDALDSMTDLLAVYDVTIPDNYTQFLDPAGLEGKRVCSMDYLATRTGYTPEIYDIYLQALTDMEDAGAEVVRNTTITGNSLGSLEWDPNSGPGESANSRFQTWPVGYGADAHYESNGGQCAAFRQAMEVYMATAGTHYKVFTEILYDGLIHPTSVGAFQSDAMNFNLTGSWPPAGSGYTCTCTDFSTNPCMGEFSKRFVQMLDDNSCDVAVYPVHGNPPPTIGDWSPDFIRNTYLAPQTGTPAITVPMGFSNEDTLPVGLMISGRHFAEGTLFEARTVAYAYEQATQHRRPTPNFPECTTGSPAVPTYASVLAISADASSPTLGPATEPLPAYRKSRKLMTEESGSA